MAHDIYLIERTGSLAKSALPLFQRSEFQPLVFSNIAGLLRRVSPQDSPIVVVNAVTFKSSGVRAVRELQQRGYESIILLTSGNGSPIPGVGAVLTPPILKRKFLNRLRAQLPPRPQEEYNFPGLVVYRQSQRIVVRGKRFKLTPRQHQLLLCLIDHGGPISRVKLFKRVWNTDYIGDTRTLDVHIAWLRKAIEQDPRRPAIIQTLRGTGYVFSLKPLKPAD
jgi:DNA-binding response OmpR family regulator